jgi:hypothetical protein
MLKESKLACPIQGITYKKLCPEILALPGSSVEKSCFVESKCSITGELYVGLQIIEACPGNLNC